MIQDFQNFTLKKCRDLIAEYQKTQDKEIVNLLLARFDNFIVYVIIKLRQQHKHLEKEDIKDLYHTSILGFYKCMDSFKTDRDPSLIFSAIKAYIIAELKQVYFPKNNEISVNEFSIYNSSQVNSGELSAFLIKESILSSNLLSNEEKELFKSKFDEELDIGELVKKYNVPRITIYKRLERITKKIKGVLKR